MIAGSNRCSNESRSRLRLEIEHIFEPAKGQAELTLHWLSTRIDVVSSCLPDRLGLKMRDLNFNETGCRDKWQSYDEAKLDVYITATRIADRAVTGRMPLASDAAEYTAASAELDRLKPIVFPRVYGVSA